MNIVVKTALLVAVALFISSCGTDETLSDLSSKKPVVKEGVITDIGILQINAEEGSIKYEYNIFARAIAGSNPCWAEGVSVALVQKRVSGYISVALMYEYPEGYSDRICTAEYDPVYKKVAITVRSIRTEHEYVVIKNVGAFGVDVRAESFID